ncbi:MAG TPA: NrfD/PsrC family molybdoenzyme membrane anchor subunit [bacterium]|nr:NrfD/PsrC family molybdoenzyme membrane anchor subunit [bacterium]
MAEHFVQPPQWEWYILGYFFLAGLTGSLYALATMLRLWGGPEDEATARAGFLIAFPVAIVCPVLLTLDLGTPLRFWHMLIATTPGQGGLMFKYWSPMSVGSWALLVYGVFTFVSFVAELGAAGWGRSPAGRVFSGVGAALGLFVASYTGVLLSVSNQPVWSDTWALGGLFLASGLTAAAALLAVCAPRPRGNAATDGRLGRVDVYFALLELMWIVLFFLGLNGAGTLSRLMGTPWLVLWLLVALGIAVPLVGGTGARRAAFVSMLAAAVVLAGTLALRAVVIFGAQV